ncbi:MAG: hypothetical protein ISP99_04455 [Pseudomonadales bacterium]|nr:hypothetical protein [Pseudomonadales bacterium]MBL6814811.1 hypothetical protein [Pseudomonadales bacterium]
MANAFENFMNLLWRKQHGLDDELSVAAKHGEGQSEAVIGDNHEPALLDGVDDAFLRELAAVAPVILEQWNDYLDAGGAMTLEQAFFGGENFALKKAGKDVKAAKDYAFLHWLYLEKSAVREGKTPPRLSDLARLYDPVNWESVAQEYRVYRAGVPGLADLSD